MLKGVMRTLPKVPMVRGRISFHDAFLSLPEHLHIESLTITYVLTLDNLQVSTAAVTNTL